MPDLQFTKELLKIASVDGKALDVWLFKPSGSGPCPLVIAGHGMTVIKDAGLAAFGRHWAADAHYASLIFDYRRSDTLQREDYQAVIRWARQRPEQFLNNKIVLMGSAMSGLVVTQLALDDPGLAGVMAHSPTLDGTYSGGLANSLFTGYDTVMATAFNPRLLFFAAIDRIKGILGLQPLFIRAVGRPTEFALLNTVSAYPGFTKMFAQGDTPFVEAPNLINPRIIFEFISARPGRQLARAYCPVLIVATKDDDMIPIRIAREVAREAKDVTFVEALGGHFDIMEGGEGFAVNIRAQVKFLVRIAT
ncbi:alpha/beta-hydrolase [Mycena filopes]|nr:alpha/beta-hydrolase [Mycena filopes]